MLKVLPMVQNVRQVQDITTVLRQGLVKVQSTAFCRNSSKHKKHLLAKLFLCYILILFEKEPRITNKSILLSTALYHKTGLSS